MAASACRQTETSVASAVQQKNNDATVGYKEEIEPIMESYCNTCHAKVTYISNLSTYQTLKAAADSGVLYERLFIKSDMPPAGNPRPAEKDFQMIKDWIKTGCTP